MDIKNISLGDGLIISLFSILTVFIVLLAISYMIDLLAFLLNRKKDKNDDIVPDDTGKKSLTEESPVFADQMDGRTVAIITAAIRASADQMDGRTIAIIAAAITAFLEKDSSFVIKKIKCKQVPLSEWESAGILDTHRRPL